MNHSRKHSHQTIIAFILLLTLLLAMPTSKAFALTFPGFGSTGSDPVLLCGSPDNLDKQVLVYESGEDASAPPDGQIWIFSDTAGNPQIVPVNWNCDDPALFKPGLHQLKGFATTSSAIQLADGYDGMITWPVFRKGDTPLEIQSLQIPSVKNPLIALGSDTSALSQTLQLTEQVTQCQVEPYWMLETKNDPTFRWVWDTSEVDSSRTGCHKITASLEYPDWVNVPESYRSFTEAVYVMPEDRIELYAPHITANGRLEFLWLYDASRVTEAWLEWKPSGGSYTACDESWYNYIEPGSTRTSSLYVDLYALPANTPLSIRLCYDDTINGQRVWRTTEPYALTIPENLTELLAEKSPLAMIEALGGDRNGSDKGETTLPDYSQPIPVTPPEDDENSSDNANDNTNSNTNNKTNNHTNSNTDTANDKQADTPDDYHTDIEYDNPAESSSPDTPVKPADSRDDSTAPPVMETVTDTYTEIGGSRLNLLISLADTVLFEKEGVSAEIPSALLKNLALEDTQLLRVTLLRPNNDTVQISVLADESHVTDLAGTIITMPWNPSDKTADTSLCCIDHTGTAVSQALYDEAHSLIRFVINTPGTYHITGQPNKEAVSSVDTAPVMETKSETENNAEQYAAPNTASDKPASMPEHAANETSPDIENSAGDTRSAQSIQIVLPILALAIAASILLVRRWRR